MNSLLTTGREPSKLRSPWRGKNKSYGSQRLDNTRMENASYEHCTFVSVSFKDCSLVQGRFRYCTFVDCYFRNSNLRDCDFVGSRFVDCQFPQVAMSNCDIRYTRFDQCVLDPDEADTNLPREPNLREELAARLAVAAQELGRSSDARKYRLWEIEARQEHLAHAVRNKNTWYREHYQGIRRFNAGVHWLASKTNGWLWGHGEKWQVLVTNLVVMTFAVFPMLFWLQSAGLSKPNGQIHLGDCFAVSAASVLSASHISTVDLSSMGTRITAGIATFSGLVAAGLLITILFRSVTRR